MRLTAAEVKRFFTLWIPLLHYANQRLKVARSFPSKWENARLSPQQVLPVRDALWANDSLLESYIAENPAGLSADDLALVASWKHRVEGSFFIVRHLKKYTVFLSDDEPARAYGVLGLAGSIEETVGPEVPLYVKAVLLPFENRIIYDGLVMPYAIHFGPGIQRDLNETYRALQERGGLLTILGPTAAGTTPESAKKSAQASNKKVLSAFQKDMGQSGLSPKMVEEHTNTIAEFAREFLLAQEPPRLLLDIEQVDVEAYLDSQPGVNLVSLKRFARFLRDTGRMDWDQAEAILDMLKRAQRR